MASSVRVRAKPMQPPTPAGVRLIRVRPGIRERVIRTAPSSLECNCHGWVFTAGQHWLKGEDVPLVLADNGYAKTVEPREGDVAIYYDPAGVVAHTALVRFVAADGAILLESKWGQCGRFIHGPKDQLYGPEPVYYHSPRRGHVIRGLDRVPGAEGAAAQAG